MNPWRLDTFKNLYNDIIRARELPSAASIRDLSHKLQTEKHSFLILLDFPRKTGKRDAFKKDPNSEVLEFEFIGTKYLIRPEFADQILLFSDIFNIDEYLAAHILLRSNEKQASIYQKSAVETAMIHFLSERSFMLACLELIIQDAYDKELPPDLRDMYSRFVQILIKEYESNLALSGSLALHVLKTIQLLKTQIDQFNTDMKTPMQPNGTLTPLQRVSFESANDAINALSQQYRILGRVLYHFSYNFQLNPEEIMKVTELVQIIDYHNIIIPHLVMSLLASIDIAKENATNHIVSFKRYEALKNDQNFVKNFNKLLVNDVQRNGNGWKIKGIHGIILLQWILFIWEILPRNPSLRKELNLTEDQLLQLANEVIQKDVFQLIIKYFLEFQIVDDVLDEDDSLSPLQSKIFSKDPAQKITGFSIEDEFQDSVIKQLQSLVRSFISKMSQCLQQIKRREEDAIQAAKLPQQPISSKAKDTASDLRHDLAAFFFLVAILYRTPDSGLKFWENRSFLKFGASVSEARMIRAYLEMLCSLATGPKSSEQADKFLSIEDQNTEWCSWKMLDKALVLYGSPPAIRVSPGASGMQSQTDNKIRPDESSILSAFIRVLSQVVQYSDTARNRFQKENIVTKLFTLLNRELMPKLKAAAINSIAAFCRSIPGNVNNIVWEVWKFLENSQIIHTIPKQTSPGSRPPPTTPAGPAAGGGGGMKKELTEAESVHQTYPQTLAFLNLINTLTQVDHERAGLLFGFPAAASSIPLDLGSSYRTPGITPYIGYVIDTVFLKAPLRSYRNPLEKWKVMANSLEIIEKCLLSFELTGSLFHNVGTQQSATGQDGSGRNQSLESSMNVDIVRFLSLHPGFDIMKRLLSKSGLIEVMFDCINDAGVKLSENSEKTPFFKEAVLRVLRIIDMASQKEARFSRILIPLVRENIPGSFENVFLNQSRIVIQIALLLICGYDDICLYAVKILSRLSRYKAFNDVDRTDGRGINRLVKILSSSDESDRILSGFVDHLENGRGENDLNTIIDYEEDSIMQIIEGTQLGHFLEENIDVSSQSVRLAIADLILDNLRPGIRSPTIAHFLLGYEFEGAGRKATIQFTDAYDTKRSCLDLILNLFGHSNKEAELDDDEARISEFAQDNPSLAARFYEIIYRLCSDSRTSEPTMIHLRTINFFASQFKLLPIHIAKPQSSERVDDSTIIKLDNTKMKIDFNTVAFNLEQKTWLFKILALELLRCQIYSQTARLLSLMLGSDSVQEWDHELRMVEEPDDSIVLDGQDESQSMAKLLELLDMLDHQWIDDEWAIGNFQRRYFDRLDIDTYPTKNKRGIPIYAIRDIYTALRSLANNLRKRGAVANMQEMEQEFHMILRFCYSHNRRTEYESLKLECFKGWREIMDVIIYNHYEILNFDRREPIIIEIITALLPKIRTNEYLITSHILSYVLVSAMSKLCQDRRSQSTLQIVTSDSTLSLKSRLPPEKLQDIFRLILYGIIAGYANTEMRMNFYVTLYLYLQYCNPELDYLITSSNFHAIGNSRDISSISLLGGGASRTWGASSARASGSNQKLIAANFAMLKELGNRLLNFLRSDASAGHVAVQLSAITTLNALCDLYKRERDNSVIDYLIKAHFISETLQELKRSDDFLRHYYGKSAADQSILHAAYLFESRIALLIRVAQRPEFAIKLLNFGIIEYLEKMTFLGERPTYNRTTTDLQGRTSYIRYHQLLLWILRLVGSILTSAGHNNNIALNKVLKFINSHQGVLAEIFTDYVPPISPDDDEICVIYLQVLCEVVPIFYYVGNGIEALDKDRHEKRQPTFHSLLRENIARYFFFGDWCSQMMDDEEEKRLKNMHKFLRLLNKNLLAWSYRVTGFMSAASEFRPIFTASLETANKRDEIQTEKEPELSALVICLRTLVEGLFNLLQRFLDHSQKLGNYNTISQADIDEILAKISENYVQLLNSTQRKTLAIQELHKMRLKTARHINTCLNDVEIALLLLWHHLEYYLSSTTSFSEFTEQPIGMSSMMAIASGSGSGPLERLRTDAQLHLKPSFDKLATLDKHLTKEIIDNYKMRNTYISMLLRKINATLGSQN
ncbi:8708_t:CDS:10 [Ambispora leptoticha]|uniref:8708_t:CDS:1 n=1 Tax=Ambispora leptoticha TaxID=144679 RepID=A0A9N8V656_9GLOM|nr:8708_t:CDS:10 [Ambispora leptoticha]